MCGLRGRSEWEREGGLKAELRVEWREDLQMC